MVKKMIFAVLYL